MSSNVLSLAGKGEASLAVPVVSLSMARQGVRQRVMRRVVRATDLLLTSTAIDGADESGAAAVILSSVVDNIDKLML